MKTKMTLAILLLTISVTALAAPDQRADLKTELTSHLIAEYGSIENSPLSSGILPALVLPLAKIDELDGTSAATTVTADRWLQAAHELRRASFVDSPLPGLRALQEFRQQARRSHIHPISLLHFDYADLKTDVNPADAISLNGATLESFDANAFEERTVFAAAALHDQTWRGSDVTFVLDPDLIFTNREVSYKSFEIDFDDGRDWQRVLPDQDIPVQYLSQGAKTIQLRATTSDNVELVSSFVFEVRSLDAPPPHDTLHLTAALSHEGVTATGDGYIYLSDEHATLTNPVILSEGFDIDNSLDWDAIYDIMNEENLVEDLRLQGYDVVVLNYHNSTTWMQANAYLVMELIQQVNTLTPGKSPILVGTSMGGLTCRYALMYMQANSIPFDISTFISLDSPQAGANIPLGLQEWVDFFAGEAAEAQMLLDALNSPAARQLLVAHHESSGSAGVNPDPLHTAFQNELQSLGGYPSLDRMVSIINGSGTQQSVGFNPGDQLIQWEYSSFEAGVIGNCWALNDASSQQIFEGELSTFFGVIILDSRDVTVPATLPWDNAPGGLSNSMEQAGNVEVPYGDLIALHPDHCFIPSISSLDLSVTDPFFDIDGHPDILSLSPFDAVYYPTLNQDHVDVTPENKQWLLFEVLGPAAPVVTAVQNAGTIELNWTPVPDAVSYLVYESTDNQVWSAPVITTATNWTDNNVTVDQKYYKVESSLLAAP